LLREVSLLASIDKEEAMILIPDVPSFDEWVMLIQRNAAQAHQVLIGLKARNKRQGVFADASLTISIEDNERAHKLFARAMTDPLLAERIRYIARIGHATAGPNPDREDWLTMIKDEPNFAEDVYTSLQTKAAMFGLQTPQTILMSIAAYVAATEELKL
jgi:hypothetical protein